MNRLPLITGTSLDIDTRARAIQLPINRSKEYDDFDFTTVPSIPCTRDHMLAAMHSPRFALFDKSISKDPLATAEAIHDNIKLAQWFDFGRIDADVLADCADDAKPFIKEGLLRAPYDHCVFRMRLTGGGDIAEVEQLILVTCLPDLPGTFGTTVLVMRTNGPRNEFLSLMYGVVIKGDSVYEVGRAVKDGSLIAFYEYAGLWSILNTRGVGKEVVVPDAKLERARARSGKPPLGKVVRVDSSRYVTALRETQHMEASGVKGDRRSPRMHLRRGHMRTFAAERFVGLKGKKRWIRAMIVGGDIENLANRDSYEVKR